jgi:hypothetical protein
MCAVPKFCPMSVSVGKLRRVARGSKFPNLFHHSYVDSEATQNVELVIEDSEAVGQSYPVSVTGLRRSNALNAVGDRVITEYAICSRYLSACRAANATDVRRSRVVDHAASHIAYLIVGEGLLI